VGPAAAAAMARGVEARRRWPATTTVMRTRRREGMKSEVKKKPDLGYVNRLYRVPAI
jgi:hypothetical protein